VLTDLGGCALRGMIIDEGYEVEPRLVTLAVKAPSMDRLKDIAPRWKGEERTKASERERGGEESPASAKHRKHVITTTQPERQPVST